MAVSGDFRVRIWGIPCPYLGNSVAVSGEFRVRIWGILMAAYGEFFVAVDTVVSLSLGYVIITPFGLWCPSCWTHG